MTKLGSRIVAVRKRLGMSQAEFAAFLNVPAQTLSRWETSQTRPRAAAMAKLNEVLNSAGAPYRPTGEDDGAARPLAMRLPLGNLSPGAFESFCADLLSLWKGEAQLIGGSGDLGVDIEVTTKDDKRWAVQVKRVERFGPSDVDRVVEAMQNLRTADRFLLALSRPASAATRRRLHSYPNWSLMDANDLSRVVRYELSPDQAKRLVAAYFPGGTVRRDFLGLPDTKAFVSCDEMFGPNTLNVATENHEWKLIGRSSQIRDLEQFINSADSALLISGTTGSGKTRFTKEVVQLAESLRWKTLFRSGNTRIRQDDINELPDRAIVVVDDADRDESLENLLSGIGRQRRALKLVLSGHIGAPSERLEAMLRSNGLAGDMVPIIELEDLESTDAEVLATAVLKEHKGKPTLAPLVAKITGGRPWLVVETARSIAVDATLLDSISGKTTPVGSILKQYKNRTLSGIGKVADRPILERLLQYVAITQPANPDSQDFQNLAHSVLGYAPQEVHRCMRILEDAGLTRRINTCIRVHSNLFAEWLVEQACLNPGSGRSTNYAESLAATAFRDQTSCLYVNILMNVARLDARLTRQGNQDPEIVDSIWDLLEQYLISDSSSIDISMLNQLRDISVAQPKRSLRLMSRLMDKHELSSLERRSLAKFIQGAGINQEWVVNTADRLWWLGYHQPGDIDSVTDHPIRLLRDLISFSSGLPASSVELILSRIEHWIADANSSTQLAMAVCLLKPVLDVDVMFVRRRAAAISTAHARVDLDVVRPLRRKVLRIALNLLQNPNKAVAIHGVDLLSSGRKLHSTTAGSTDEKWETEGIWMLNQLQEQLKQFQPAPVIRNQLFRRVTATLPWDPPKLQQALVDTTTLIERDIATQLCDVLTVSREPVLGPVGETFDDYRRRTHEAQIRHDKERERVASVLRRNIPGAGKIVDLLSQSLDDLDSVNALSPLDTDPFIQALCQQDIDIAKEILARWFREPIGELERYVSTAFVAVLRLDADEAMSSARRIMSDDNLDHMRRHLVGALVAADFSGGIGVDAIEILQRLAYDSDFDTQKAAVTALQTIGGASAGDRINVLFMLLESATYENRNEAVELIVNSFLPGGSLMVRDLTTSQVQCLTEPLVGLQRLDGIMLPHFISELSYWFPDQTLDILIQRITRSQASTASPIDPVPFQWINQSPLKFGSSSSFYVLREIVDWAVRYQEQAYTSWYGPVLFSAAVHTFTSKVLNQLLQIVCEADDRKTTLEVVTNLIKHAPRTFVWEHHEWVADVLNLADRIDPFEHLEVVIGNLQSAVLTGFSERAFGMPSSDDLQLQIESERIVKYHQCGTPPYRFYKGLIGLAARNIDEAKRRDSERLSR